ncbi:NADPH-dependent F420 reductase (plasmid) [Agrobacterium sp. rho-13.3]|uniref:NADPH-dependent F420 reductase n=1 Tax=Agrobacterium sp. rho-13.3 TaxID=3072980 RepID=UPI002A149A61|nr:NAD(P)-binding domain-containing protein [Agrobacterium sp. rho-13.3]MDX8311882.1 NAD(P)-binding domain-containing protein [Agrobacterium sp. rho-13.3]
MNIGIIGAGAIGSTLAGKLVKAGHTVKIANSRGPDTLGDVAAKTGATAVAIADAVKDVQVVVIAIPLKNVATLPADLFAGVPEDVIVIDPNNYDANRDGQIAAIDAGQPQSRWVSDRLGRAVVKVFNNTLFQVIAIAGTSDDTTGGIAIPVAGDDARQKAVVIDLVKEIGFQGVDAGSIDDSWHQQPGAPVYLTDYDANGVRAALARADKALIPVNRDKGFVQFGQQLKADTTQADFIAIVRKISRTTF